MKLLRKIGGKMKKSVDSLDRSVTILLLPSLAILINVMDSSSSSSPLSEMNTRTVAAIYWFIRNGMSDVDRTVDSADPNEWMLQLLHSPELQYLKDIQFLVGSETIRAHRLVLAGRSVIFRQMLYAAPQSRELDGDQVVNSTYLVRDIEAETFHALLRYIYAKILPTNQSDAQGFLDLMYSGQKYVIPSLVDDAVRVVNRSLNAANVVRVLDRSTELNQKGLVEQCWTVIRASAAEILTSAEFLRFDGRFLRKFLQQDQLTNVVEVTLFARLLEWAEQRTNGQFSGQALRQVLEPVLYDVRFLSMNGSEFAGLPCQSGVLTKEEQLDILLSINCGDNGKNWKMSSKFSKLRRGPTV
jgi:hypothetical protein